jgi:hypothetical protein
MTYDDASWHVDTVLEHELDERCAATHIGIFFAWLAQHGMVDPGFCDLAPLTGRAVTPGAFLLQHCAGEIDPFMLTARGSAFADAAYRAYVRTYERIPAVARYDPSYAAPDGWELYDGVAPTIDEAYHVFSQS